MKQNSFLFFSPAIFFGTQEPIDSDEGEEEEESEEEIALFDSWNVGASAEIKEPVQMQIGLFIIWRKS